MREALSRLDPDITVAVLNDTPQFDMSPPACLSKHLDDTHQCGTTPGQALSRSITAAQEQAVVDSGATVIDLTSYFCTDVWCPVVTGNTLMYRDAHHVSRQYSWQLRGALWERLALDHDD